MSLAAVLLVAGCTAIGGAAFRLRGSAAFERITGRGAFTARAGWGAVMALVAWVCGAGWDVAALTGLGAFLGALPGWYRSLSLGLNQADGPVGAQYLRHFARGLFWPLPAAVLPGAYLAAWAWWLGLPAWSLDLWLPFLVVAASGLACLPAYLVGKAVDRTRMTEVGEVLFGGVMAAAVSSRLLIGGG